MQWVHRQTIWSFSLPPPPLPPSCFLQHFVRSPVLCHFDPRWGCSLTSNTLGLTFKFMFPIAYVHTSYADGRFKSKLPYKLQAVTLRVSLDISEHRNDLELSAAALHPNVDGCVKCMSIAQGAVQQDMWFQSVSFLTARVGAFIYLTVSTALKHLCTHVSKPPNTVCVCLISLCEQCHCVFYPILCHHLNVLFESV